MDYKKHYDRLIERSRNRNIKGYTEKHHIIPRCLGGDNSKENLVELTPEEHYVAHQLLVKIHPKHYGLIWAAILLSSHPNGKRSTNKLYGWLRRKYSKEAKKRIGKKNGSYGRSWYHDPKTQENGKFKKDEVPVGWVKGRVPKSIIIIRFCKECGVEVDKIKIKRKFHKNIFCNNCRKKSYKNMGKNLKKISEIRSKIYLITYPSGRRQIIKNLNKFCREYCQKTGVKLDQGQMSKGKHKNFLVNKLFTAKV